MVYSNMILAAGRGRVRRASSPTPAPPGRSSPTCRWRSPARIREALDARGLALVPLVAPTTPAERRQAICESAEGFVYLVSTVGVTGEREELPPELTELIEAVKSEAEVPVAVGFGIATAEQAGAVGRPRRRGDHRQPPGADARRRRRRGRGGSRDPSFLRRGPRGARELRSSERQRRGARPRSAPTATRCVADGLLFCSGQIPLDPESGELVGETAAEQAAQCLREPRGGLRGRRARSLDRRGAG